MQLMYKKDQKTFFLGCFTGEGVIGVHENAHTGVFLLVF